MKHGLLILYLLAFALLGCNKAGEPASNIGSQALQKDQPVASAPLALWSPEFKDKTVKECIQLATRDLNTEGVRRCRCAMEKASTTMTEQQFHTVGTDPAVRESIRQIGLACK
jgi:uncharacterized lipoprotein NlpE involved in copper resistance